MKVHGQTVPTSQFQRGVVAGCSWAKDILKALISDIKERCAEVGLDLRDYVDDITTRETSEDIDTLAHRAHTGLQFAKQLICHAGLKDNEVK